MQYNTEKTIYRGPMPRKQDPLQKTLPKNRKYSSVSTKLNSGRHVNKVAVDSLHLQAKKKNELFQRMKPYLLAKMIRHWDSTLEQDCENEDTNSTISGWYDESFLSKEYSLLDLRDPEDFMAMNIRSAVNYPAENIARDKMIPAIFNFKNRSDRLIVIYSHDERAGVKYAQQFAEKDYTNVFLLSGGLESFQERYSNLIQGAYSGFGASAGIPVKKKMTSLGEYGQIRDKMRSSNIFG